MNRCDDEDDENVKNGENDYVHDHMMIIMSTNIYFIP